MFDVCVCVCVVCACVFVYVNALTRVDDVVDGDVFEVRHESEHGEDDEAGEHGRRAVHHRHDDGVPTGARRAGRVCVCVCVCVCVGRVWCCEHVCGECVCVCGPPLLVGGRTYHGGVLSTVDLSSDVTFPVPTPHSACRDESALKTQV